MRLSSISSIPLSLTEPVQPEPLFKYETAFPTSIYAEIPVVVSSTPTIEVSIFTISVRLSARIIEVHILLMRLSFLMVLIQVHLPYR